jgi:alanine racemase
MDLVVVDVTDIEGVAEDDKAVLMGRDGKEHISAWELAKVASTIPYEILTSFGKMCSKRTYRVQN